MSFVLSDVLYEVNKALIHTNTQSEVEMKRYNFHPPRVQYYIIVEYYINNTMES